MGKNDNGQLGMEMVMAKGILYVMDTVVDGLVKIGKTTKENFPIRMRQLENNGYYNVVGLKRRFAIEVDDYDEKETLLHTIFERSQVGKSELFSLDIETVVQLLSSLDGDVVYPKKVSKDEIFDEAVEQALREAENSVDVDEQEDDDEAERSPSELAKIDYWKRFYEHVAKDEDMKVFGDISKHKDNANNYVAFATGLGNDCRIEVIHRTKGTGTIIVQVWCQTNKYYPALYDSRDDIEKAVAHLPGSLVWDSKQEGKQEGKKKKSRKVRVKRTCNGNDEDDFQWACSWAKALYPILRNILLPGD